LYKLAGGGEITRCTMLLGNVKAAECLISVTLHGGFVPMWRIEATRMGGEKGLEKEPDSTPKR
jgi:hypothetical protein